MAHRGYELFGQLQSANAVLALIGKSEDAHLDCKEWPINELDAQRAIAKAACGLTNSEGGVLVIGMKARSVAKDEPDLIDSPTLVGDTSAVRSKILDLVGQLVEPGIEGVQATEISHPTGSKSGLVVVYIPASEGSPRRSKKDWKFYQRIGSGTFPMEYFQIEERFGRRPHPKLELYLDADGIKGLTNDPRTPARRFVLGLKNIGRGIAKFPSIRYRRASNLLVDQFGIDGNCGLGIPQRPAEKGWVVFRGGVDDIIYPEELRKITMLNQAGATPPQSVALPGRLRTPWIFAETPFQCEISCEGAQTETVEVTLREDECLWPQT